MNPKQPVANSPRPTTPVSPTPPQQSPEQEKKFNLIEKLVELDLGIHMFVGAILLFIVIFIVAWRFDLVGYFQKSKPAENPTVSQSKPEVILAKPSNLSSVFISSQKVNVEKAFEAEPIKVKLTLGKRLTKEVFGFLPYWLLDQSDKVNISMLTAVSYFGLEVDGEGNIASLERDGKASEAWVSWQDNPKLDKFINRAKRNRTKVYVTLKAFDNSNIERIVGSEEASLNFINTALYLMSVKSLDGINIDFEYIGTPSQLTRDGFSLLISDLNEELKRQYPKSKLTIATYIDAASETRLYDTPILAQNSDALVIMGYDFHTPNSTQAGPVAPMEGYGNSMLGFMTSYLEKVPADKLILAVPYYGYDWPVDTTSANGQVISGAEVKIYPYAEIVDATKNTQINWDENSQTPWYSYKDESGANRVVHFENARSLAIKYDFINNKNLQGVGIWALGFDGLRSELLQLISDKFSI